jgi:hypothetical protein
MGPFLTEDDWQAAFGAAALMLQGAEQRGQVTFKDGATLRTVAADVATAVILAPVRDITTEPNVSVDDRGVETNSYNRRTA